MKKICDFLEAIISAVLIILGTGMIVVGVMQVVWRYVLKLSLPWSEELMRYMFIWLVMIGISVGVRYKKHVAIDVLADSLQGSSKFIVKMIIACCCLVLYFFMIKFGSDFMLSTVKMKSSAMRLPMWCVNLSMPIGEVLALIFQIEEIIEMVKTRGKPNEEKLNIDGAGEGLV